MLIFHRSRVEDQHWVLFLYVQWPGLSSGECWRERLAAAYLKPVEKVGERYQEEKRVTHGHRLHKSRHVLHIQDMSGTGVEIGVDDGGQEGDTAPPE